MQDGQESPAPTPAPTPAPFRAERTNEIAQAMEGWDWDAGSEKPMQAAAPEDGEPAAPEETDAPAAEEDAPTEPDAEEESAPADDEPEAEAEEVKAADDDGPDPKRLEKLQAAERRHKEAIAQERAHAEAAIQAKWEELAPVLERVKKYEELERRGGYDLPGLLKAYGWTPERYAMASKQLWALSPEGQKDPRLAAEAAREIRDQELEDRFRKQDQTIHELKSLQESQKAEQRINVYLDRVARAVSDETPIVKAMLAKNPDRAKKLLADVAEHLTIREREIPSEAAVLRELEKIRLKEYEDDGHDLSKFKRTQPKTKTPAAGENKTAKTETQKQTKPEVNGKSRAELRAEAIRDMPL